MAAKSTDIPRELREFNKVFQRLTYRFDTFTAYRDYLDYCLYIFNTERDPKFIERLKDHYKDHYSVFPEAFREHVLVNYQMISETNEWYDLMGTYYEAVLSSSKASAFGQFFTPPSVCNMIAQMHVHNEKPVQKRVNDPACGSGRTLLAFHAIAPGNFMYGDDLDPMCSAMCAVNLVMHGAQGQVCNMNSLSLDDWRFGYEINPHLYTLGLISIRPISKDQAFSLQHWKHTPVETEKPPVMAQEAKKQPILGNQLNLF